MVSTGKEGVIYNGLSDWLYEGEGAGGKEQGLLCSLWAPAAARLGLSVVSFPLTLLN